MDTRLKSLIAALGMAGYFATPAIAASTDAAKLGTTRSLQMQLASLQKEVNHLESELATKQASEGVTHHKVKRMHKHVHTKTYAPQNNTAYSQPVQNSMTGQDIVKLISESHDYLPFDLEVPGRAFVSTGPYVGVPIQFAGTNLIVNSPSVNTDVQLLNIRKSIYHQLNAMMGLQPTSKESHSHLLLSGIVETQANYTDVGGAPSTTDIDVTNMSIDAFFIGPSNWLLGFIELTYDNGTAGSNMYRVANSRVYVNKAFATIGDFSESPFYGSFGQFYVPFGTYSTVMVSDPLPKLLARTKARSILIGMQQQGDNAFYGSTYIFRGDSHAASVSKIDNGGINVGYRLKQGIVSADIGGGIIANIADSGGMQSGTHFSAYEQIAHRVPAYNLRANLALGESIDFIAEYVGASTQFNPNDMSYNGHGAKPWALDTEGAYSFKAWDRPSSIGLGYAMSNQALALDIPLMRYSVVFNTSVWRNTLQSLEFRHDRNYAASNTANGPTGAAASPGACTSAACSQSGKSDNAVTAQFDYYF